MQSLPTSEISSSACLHSKQLRLKTSLITETFKFQPGDGVKRRAQKALTGNGSTVFLKPCDILHTALVSRSDEPCPTLDPWAFWGRPFTLGQDTTTCYQFYLLLSKLHRCVLPDAAIGKGNIFVVKVLFTHILPPSPSLPLVFVALHHTTSSCAPDGLRTKCLHVLGGARM